MVCSHLTSSMVDQLPRGNHQPCLAEHDKSGSELAPIKKCSSSAPVTQGPSGVCSAAVTSQRPIFPGFNRHWQPDRAVLLFLPNHQLSLPRLKQAVGWSHARPRLGPREIGL